MATTVDHHFPVLHRIHPRGWINDPNGILRAGDRWHVFFQHNPHSARHENICWGHMSSSDLVSWREEPMGPRPRAGEADQDGCWSGVGLVDRRTDPAGVPTLVYSGVDGVENQLARVVVARMDADATEIVEPGRVVADVPDIPGLIGVRDPFVLEFAGRRWAIQGAGIREGDGYVPALLLYSCDDLDRWEYVGPLLRGDHPVAAQLAPADLWECPQLVRVGERWVLLLSLWRHPDAVERSTIQVNYLVGAMTADEQGRPRFDPATGGRADLGPDFYAPQAVVDTDGDRVLLWGWSWEGQQRSPEQIDAQGWAGALTFPRELRLVEDSLLAGAPAELGALRGAALMPEATGAAVGDAEPRPSVTLDVPARAEVRTDGRLRLEIVGPNGLVASVVEHEGGPATLFVDGSLVELIPDRSTPTTARFYADPQDRVRISGALAGAWELRVPGVQGSTSVPPAGSGGV